MMILQLIDKLLLKFVFRIWLLLVNFRNPLFMT